MARRGGKPQGLWCCLSVVFSVVFLGSLVTYIASLARLSLSGSIALALAGAVSSMLGFGLAFPMSGRDSATSRAVVMTLLYGGMLSLVFGIAGVLVAILRQAP